MIRRYRERRRRGAPGARRGAAPRHRAPPRATNPIAIKHALTLLGHDVGGSGCRSSRRRRRGEPPYATASRLGLLQAAAVERASAPGWRRPEPRRRLSAATAPVHCAAMSDALRIIPLGGLGEVGKNMTVYEFGDEHRPDRRRPRVPARRAPRRRSRPAGLLVPRRPAAARDRPHPRPRGSRRRAAVRAARGRGRRGDRHAAHARADQVEARRARARLVDDAHGRPTRRATPMQIGPVLRLEFVRMAHSIPDCCRDRARDARGTRPAHGRLEARPHARRRAQDGRRAARASSATAASTCCSATRRTPSGRA